MRCLYRSATATATAIAAVTIAVTIAVAAAVTAAVTVAVTAVAATITIAVVLAGNFQYSMNMVRHYHKFSQFHIPKMVNNFMPQNISNNTSCR